MSAINAKPPQAGGVTAGISEAAANIAAPEVSPAIRRGATHARPWHRVVNPLTRSCDTCMRYLHDCRCPAGVHCVKCELDPEDAAFVGLACEYSADGKHEWRDENGDEIDPWWAARPSDTELGF